MRHYPTNSTTSRPVVGTAKRTDATAGKGLLKKPAKQIDYVLFRPAGHYRVVSAAVIDEPVASDHRPVRVVLEPRAK
jgi:endonuclease/exonuclease/phosphatase family metal-dependent hydrolase